MSIADVQKSRIKKCYISRNSFIVFMKNIHKQTSIVFMLQVTEQETSFQNGGRATLSLDY